MFCHVANKTCLLARGKIQQNSTKRKKTLALVNLLSFILYLMPNQVQFLKMLSTMLSKLVADYFKLSVLSNLK